ncbi:MAG TPA: nucleotidyltransferase family protein [Solirubrobacteraceae bacterium]|nr:nucleotidyltransferase family protein [Solirubrobacteraceae bacterium]
MRGWPPRHESLRRLDDERAYTDSDLLVQRADVAQAAQTLRGLGFVRVDRDEDWCGPGPKYAHTFSRARDGALIDLHWRLSGASAAPEDEWSTLSVHTRPLEVGGQRIAALDEPASAVLVALHAAHHGASRSVALAELERAAQILGPDVWSEAARLAERLGAGEQFAAGLRFAPLGARLADHLELAAPSSVDLWLRANPGTNGASLLDKFTQTSGILGRLEICLRVAQVG